MLSSVVFDAAGLAIFNLSIKRRASATWQRTTALLDIKHMVFAGVAHKSYAWLAEVGHRFGYAHLHLSPHVHPYAGIADWDITQQAYGDDGREAGAEVARGHTLRPSVLRQ